MHRCPDIWQKLIQVLYGRSEELYNVQADEAALKDLIINSSLPSFVTDLSAARRALLPGRIAIPITDPDAHITFYLLFGRGNKRHADVFTRIAQSA